MHDVYQPDRCHLRPAHAVSSHGLADWRLPSLNIEYPKSLGVALRINLLNIFVVFVVSQITWCFAEDPSFPWISDSGGRSSWPVVDPAGHRAAALDVCIEDTAILVTWLGLRFEAYSLVHTCLEDAGVYCIIFILDVLA